MEMTGIVIAVLQERSGVSQRGEWKTQSYVIETQEQYPKHLCFDVLGTERIAKFAIKDGEQITVQFDIDARQYQDRWFNSIKAWNVTRPGQQPQGQQGYQQPPQGQQWSANPQAAAQAAQNGQQQIMQSAVSNGQPVSNTPPAGESDNLPF